MLPEFHILLDSCCNISHVPSDYHKLNKVQQSNIDPDNLNIASHKLDDIIREADHIMTQNSILEYVKRSFWTYVFIFIIVGYILYKIQKRYNILGRFRARGPTNMTRNRATRTSRKI